MGSVGSITNRNGAVNATSFANTSRNIPYSTEPNPVDSELRTRLETLANDFDPNIRAHYSRWENVIYMGLNRGRIRAEYNLSTKAGNEFKKQIEKQLQSMGLEVEKMGKHKSEGMPEYWFRIKVRK